MSNEIATRMQEGEPAEQDQTEEQKDLCEQEQDPSPTTPLLTWAQAVVLLCTIPGISQRAAEGILAEIGLEMSRFPSAGHVASWAGCALATTRVRANGFRVGPAKVTPGCVNC